MRLVSLCPSNTEIAGALGLTPQLVGIDDWSDWPPEVAGKPRVGSDLSVDLDRVVALEPDLVLASLSVPGMERNVAGLVERGLPHLVLDPHSLADVLSDVLHVGGACHVRDRAQAVVEEARGRIERVRARAEGRPLRRIYWEWWPKPLIAAARRSWIQEMCEIVRCTNVFGDADCPSAKVEADDVIRRDPELVVACWCGTLQRIQEPSRVTSREGWGVIDAIVHGRVYCLPESLFGRPSQRLVEGLEMLEGIIEGIPAAASA